MLNLTVMLIHSLLQMVSALPGSSNPSSFSPLHPLHPRCHFGQPCWPSASVWSSFNASISGRLIASHPSADPCHDPHYSVDLCAAAHANWTSSDWRTSQVGAYAGILWEVGSGSCFPDTSEQQKCDQGMVAELSVDARSVEDVQAAVRFAGQHDLYLVVKNTGHDHLGRSSGAGSFAIWTHNMKGRQWLRSFVPHGAPKSCKGVPAVTLQPGEQWLDVYRDADAHNVTIVGGSARTVGTSGGYLLGGGHSPFAHFYGLAADNLLEATIVTPSGEHLTLNEYTDRDYFWAIRGGGGSNWGVLTSVTYKTHPLPTAIQVAVAQFNVSTAQQFRSIMSTILKTLPEITAAGYTGYGDTDLSAKTIGLIFLQPNGTDTALESLAPLAALALNPETGVSGLFANSTFPTWLDYTDYFLKDPNVATNVQDGSRLMTPDVLVNKTDEVLDVIMEYADMGAGFNFIGRVNPAQRDNTAVHPIWKESCALLSLSADWSENATASEKKQKKQRLVALSEALGKVVGPHGGTYINEANPYEPDWQRAFWGPNYERLLEIKRRIDPKALFACNRCVGSDIIYEP